MKSGTAIRGVLSPVVTPFTNALESDAIRVRPSLTEVSAAQQSAVVTALEGVGISMPDI